MTEKEPNDLKEDDPISEDDRERAREIMDANPPSLEADELARLQRYRKSRKLLQGLDFLEKNPNPAPGTGDEASEEEIEISAKLDEEMSRPRVIPKETEGNK